LNETLPRTGTLWIVATPIGNLDDLSLRARRVLGEADVIAAEDTRTSRKLLPPRDSAPEWIALHEHNEAKAVARVLDAVARGLDAALVSDAGTPLISDPGYRLVDAAHARGLRVTPIPGACAAIAALCAAGLASDRFAFEGFVPARAAARRKRFGALAQATATLLFYVPARDLIAVLEDAAAAFGGERTAVVARELTKRFETIRRSTLAELRDWVEADPDQQRGEAVLLVAGAETADATAIDSDLLARELAAELPPARAARVLARVTSMDRRTAFARIESLRGDASEA